MDKTGRKLPPEGEIVLGDDNHHLYLVVRRIMDKSGNIQKL